MNREAYELANRIQTKPDADYDYLSGCPGEIEMRKYKNTVLQEIKKEKQQKKNSFRGVLVAACAALVLLTSTVLFGDEVHAMVKQISWSIGSALGISSDLANYREIVNTSVADHGYVITLQEAVASEDKLIINYTLQREDGAPMEEMLTADGNLYVNGKNVTSGVGGSAEYLDEEQTMVGVVNEYYVENVDFSGENHLEIAFERIGITDSVKGKWNFAFTADGAELIADTKRIAIGKTFALPDGTEVVIEELAMNELEQRISYTLSSETDYILKIEAADSTGKQVEFDVRTQDKKGGHMQNEEIIEDGRLDENAETVIMTLYAVELPKESGKMSSDYVQIGESFEVRL